MLSEQSPGNSTYPSLKSDAARSELRYGLIGSGMMGQEHIRNVGLLEGARIAALADPDDAMRNQAAQLAGSDCMAYASHREMLSDDAVDALIIASPNHTHIDVLRDVISTGKPLLVEKPLCTTVADSREIIRLANARTAPVWVAMEYRYMPPMQRLLDEIRNGTAGRPRMIAIREHRFPFLQKVGDWNRSARNTGGTMVEKCCHFFDLMRLLADSEAVRVYASGGADVNAADGGTDPDVLDNAFVIVDFSNGMRAMLDLCMFAEGSYWQETVSVTGDAARIDALVPGPARFSADGSERSAEIVISPRATKVEKREAVAVDESILAAGDHHGSTFYQHQKFLELLREGGVPEVSLEDGLKAVIIGAAAEESIRTGMPVTLA